MYQAEESLRNWGRTRFGHDADPDEQQLNYTLNCRKEVGNYFSHSTRLAREKLLAAGNKMVALIFSQYYY
jgi:hypothetical protein